MFCRMNEAKSFVEKYDLKLNYLLPKAIFEILAQEIDHILDNSDSKILNSFLQIYPLTL